MWGAHRCKVKGCGEWLTCDGGMKPRRYWLCKILCKIQNTFLVFYLISSSNVCAARYSGVISYKHSSTRVVSGCTQKPSPGNQVSWILINWPWQAKNTINWKTIFSSVQTTRMTQDLWFWQRISQKRRNPSWSKVGRWSIMHKVWQ